MHLRPPQDSTSDATRVHPPPPSPANHGPPTPTCCQARSLKNPRYLSPAPSTLLQAVGHHTPDHPLQDTLLCSTPLAPLSLAVHCGETRPPPVTLDALWIFFFHGPSSSEMQDVSSNLLTPQIPRAQLAPPPHSISFASMQSPEPIFWA